MEEPVALTPKLGGRLLLVIKVLPKQFPRIALIGLTAWVVSIQNLHGVVVHDPMGAHLVGFGFPSHFAFRDALGFHNRQWLWHRPELIETFNIYALAANALIACYMIVSMYWHCRRIEDAKWRVSINFILVRTLMVAISFKLAFMIHMHNLHWFMGGILDSSRSLLLNTLYIWILAESLLASAAGLWIYLRRSDGTEGAIQR